jgi:predicted peptidase
MSLGLSSRGVMTFVVCLSFGSLVAADPPAAGKQVATSTTVKVKGSEGEREATLRYWLYLPSDYDAKASEKWPLLLFLHGSGERGEDIEKVKIHGPPKLVAQGKSFPFVLVSPQVPTSGRGWNADELAKLVDELTSTYRIDSARLYVTGLSMGGSGTWSLVSSYPGKFAAAMPLCGRGDLGAVEKLANTPIWVLVGAKDREQTVQNCQEMAAALAKAGGKGRLTVYFELPHDCWTVTYNNPETYDWLLSHRLAAGK